MSFVKQSKSILFKERYYSISYKLNFILNYNLFKVVKSEYKLYNSICQHKFILDLVITNKVQYNYYSILEPITYIKRDKTTYQFYKYQLLHRDDGPAYIKFNKNKRCEKYYQYGYLIKHLKYKNDILVRDDHYENGWYTYNSGIQIDYLI